MEKMTDLIRIILLKFGGSGREEPQCSYGEPSPCASCPFRLRNDKCFKVYRFVLSGLGDDK